MSYRHFHCPARLRQKSGGPRCSHNSIMPFKRATSRKRGCAVKPLSLNVMLAHMG